MDFLKKIKVVYQDVLSAIKIPPPSDKKLKNKLPPKETKIFIPDLNKKLKTKKKTDVNLKNNKKMTVFNYGVGGSEIKIDANEAIQEIQGNKTLLISKLTTEDAIVPEIVSGLKTVEDVFKHFSPNVSVHHITEEGKEIKEKFEFNNLGDFSPKKLVENSEFLKGLKLKEEQYNKIVKQLRINKVLRKLMEDETAKKEFADALRAIAKELEND